MKDMKKAVKITIGIALAAVFQSMAAGVVDIRNAAFEQTDPDGYPVGWKKLKNWHGERSGHNGSGGIVYECSDISKASREHVRQKIRLQPGKRYRLSGLVKTENLVTERKSGALGMTVYISGFNAKGKQIFGCAAQPFVSGTSKDWVKVEGLTAEVPEEVVEAYVGPLADGRCTGSGIVDGVYVEELDQPPVAGVFTDAYRNESAGGDVEFLASLNLDRSKVSIGDCTAEFTYLAADGKRKSVPAKVLSHRNAIATVDTTPFAVGTNDVVFTVYAAGKKEGGFSLRFARLSEPTRRKVSLDRHGRTIVDGKPFFPLGMFSGKVTKEMLDIYSEGPFNCLMPYVRPGKAEFDLCHAKGLKVMFFLNGGWRTKDDGKGWIENRIATFKDHPAMLAWYMSDEPSLDMAPQLAVRRAWAHAADPDHPIWVVLDRPQNVRYYLDCFDMYAMDKYPVPNKPIRNVIDSMRDGNAATLRVKPVWYVPQSFGWGWLNRPRTRGRGPNRDELANMTWQSIAGGAYGIVYYSFGQVLKRPRDGSEDCFEAAWERVKSAASEVKKYESVLLSVEEAPAVSGATDEVAVRTWRHDGSVYLLAVNCTAEPRSAVLTLPSAVDLASSDFGPAPKVDGAKISLDFAPLGYVMMRLDMR